MDFNIFPFMDDIDFLSYEQFNNSVSDARAKMLYVDKALIGSEPAIVDWNGIVEVPDGRFDTVFRGIRLECFLSVEKDAPLYVMFSGCNTRKTPRFSRWSYHRFCRGSVLCIADPMLKMYEHLTLGWYYGNDEFNLREMIAAFVEEVAGMLHLDNKNIIFAGSSGGGAAAFECASYLPGAKAVAINPQIVLKEYYYAEEFSRLTGNDLDNDILGHRNNALYYIQNSVNNPYLIIANMRSAKDMMQIGHIRDTLSISIQYGLNIYKNLVIWLYDADVAPFMNPHDTQEYYCVWFMIEYLLRHLDDMDKCLSLQPLYRLVNEFWHDHWMLKRQQKEKTKKWAEAVRAISCTNREVAVFGSGRIAYQLLNDLLDVQGSNYFHVRYIIDNNIHREGVEFLGYAVTHPSTIEDWGRLYVIIATELYADEIRQQLEELGLEYQKDFINGVELM